MEEILNLKYDDSKVCWEYGGREYQRIINGIEHADVQGKYIYVEVYINGSFGYYYIRTDNKRLFIMQKKGKRY